MRNRSNEQCIVRRLAFGRLGAGIVRSHRHLECNDGLYIFYYTRGARMLPRLPAIS